MHAIDCFSHILAQRIDAVNPQFDQLWTKAPESRRPDFLRYNWAMLDTKAFGFKVLRAREEADMRQDDLAQRVGVDRGYISKIEKGKSVNITMGVLYRLAEALNLSPAYLLGFTEDPQFGVDGEQDLSLAAHRESVHDETINVIAIMGRLSEQGRRNLLQVAEAFARSEERAHMDQQLFRSALDLIDTTGGDQALARALQMLVTARSVKQAHPTVSGQTTTQAE